MLHADVRYLKNRYALDSTGKSVVRLVIKSAPLFIENDSTFTVYFGRNEAASKLYTTDVITEMFKDAGGALFDSRSVSFGPTLQVGSPSPSDRARATRLTLKCMDFIEKHHHLIQGQPQQSRQAGPESAAVIIRQGSSIVWKPVQEMIWHADTANVLGTHAWWGGVKEWVQALAGHSEFSGFSLQNRTQSHPQPAEPAPMTSADGKAIKIAYTKV